MREPVRDRGRLSHMIDAIDCVLKNTQSMGFNDLHIKERHPKTPWNGIVKMRHILVHDYYQVDDKELWNVIQDDLPILRQQIMEYILTVDWDEWEKQSFTM